MKRLATYPAVYTDARGVESTSITNDGETLRLLLRGVSFVGPDFDALEPEPGDLDRAQARFTLAQGCLHACVLEWTMPMLVVHQERAVECPLRARLELGYPHPDGGNASEALLLELTTPSGRLRSAGRSGWFEDELLDLARQLPPGDSIRACITCAFSDYSPYGHGLFGGLACFRDAKEAYRRVTGKQQLFDVWDLMTDFVQETYLCDQYQTRKPGAGYRG